MGLPVEQLGTDEHVVRVMREHVKHLFGAAAVCLLALAGLVVVLLVGPDTGFFAFLDTVGWIAFVVLVVVFGVWPYLVWRMRSYTLTTERLATRQGVLRRSGRDIPLARINDVAFEQGVVDRLVGAGTLRVSAASEEGTVVLRDIPEIHEVVKLLNAQVRQARGEDR